MKYENFSFKAYCFFAITILILVLTTTLAVFYFIDQQEQDAQIINTLGRQRMLCQRITKQVYSRIIEHEDGLLVYDSDVLRKDLEDFKKVHHYLIHSNQDLLQNETIDSLLKRATLLVLIISNQGKAALEVQDTTDLKLAAAEISDAESEYLMLMKEATNLFQRASEQKVRQARNIAFLLAGISLIIILAEFLLVIFPIFKNLQRNNANLKKKNKQLADFYQITAQNLKAPLDNIIFLSRFYKEEVSAEEKKLLFEKMDNVIGNLEDTVRVLIDFLRSNEMHDVSKETVYFENAFLRIQEALHHEISKSKAVITTDFSKAPSIYYHQNYLDSIFLNLISNAIKYKSPDRTPEIHISTTLVKNGIQLKIEDNGLGIDLQRQGKNIFGLHQTFHNQENAKGIGLFVTKNQVDSLGGKIEVQSEPDKGSAFKVTFEKLI